MTHARGQMSRKFGGANHGSRAERALERSKGANLLGVRRKTGVNHEAVATLQALEGSRLT